MALGPKEMSEAIIRNLKQKTGKTLKQWIALIQANNLHEKREIVTFLKSEGLGHIQAQTIFARFQGSDPYMNPSTFADSIFDTQESKELYEFTRTQILDLAGDIRIQPCKTYIPFYRKNQFAILSKNKSGGTLLGLNLPENHPHKKFTNKSRKGSARITYQTVIESKSDLDTEVMTALKWAYQNN